MEIAIIGTYQNFRKCYNHLETVTQKELMVIPNAPRFLREGDQIIISTKIANLTEKELSGQAHFATFLMQQMAKPLMLN